MLRLRWSLLGRCRDGNCKDGYQVKHAMLRCQRHGPILRCVQEEVGQFAGNDAMRHKKAPE